MTPRLALGNAHALLGADLAGMAAGDLAAAAHTDVYARGSTGHKLAIARFDHLRADWRRNEECAEAC